MSLTSIVGTAASIVGYAGMIGSAVAPELYQAAGIRPVYGFAGSAALSVVGAVLFASGKKRD